MDESLKTLIRQMLADSRDLMDGLISGRLTVDTWQQQQARSLLVFHAAAFLAGRNERTLSPGARQAVLDIVAEQVDYLNGFATDLDAGKGSEAQRRARAALYVGALKHSYSLGQHFDWPLPFHPTQGSECQGACGCRWELTVIDAENLDGDAYWRMGKAAERHCATCPQRAAASPYRIRGGRLV